MRTSEWHSPTGEPRQRDKLGHGKNVSHRGALTFWRAQTERQVREQKEGDVVIGTHPLESPDRGTRQDTECEREIDESVGEEISTG